MQKKSIIRPWILHVLDMLMSSSWTRGLLKWRTSKVSTSRWVAVVEAGVTMGRWWNLMEGTLAETKFCKVRQAFIIYLLKNIPIIYLVIILDQWQIIIIIIIIDYNGWNRVEHKNLMSWRESFITIYLFKKFTIS